MATGKAPVLQPLADINAVSLARAALDPVTLLLVRIAAGWSPLMLLLPPT